MRTGHSDPLVLQLARAHASFTFLFLVLPVRRTHSADFCESAETSVIVQTTCVKVHMTSVKVQNPRPLGTHSPALAFGRALRKCRFKSRVLCVFVSLTLLISEYESAGWKWNRGNTWSEFGWKTGPRATNRHLLCQTSNLGASEPCSRTASVIEDTGW